MSEKRSNNLKEEKEKLKKAIELKKELELLQPKCVYNVFDSTVDWGKEVTAEDVASFIDTEWKDKIPKEKSIILDGEQPKKINFGRLILFIILGIIACIVISPSIIVFFMGTDGVSVVFKILFLVIVLIVITYFIISNVSKNKRSKFKDAEIEKYNAEVYPKLLQEYEEKRAEYTKTFLIKTNEINKQVYALRKQVEDLDILSFKYLPYAQDILDYIIDQRVENVKEAISLLIQEAPSTLLLNSQQNATKEKIKQLEEEKLSQQNSIGNEVKKAEGQATKKGRWARLSKLAKAMIIVPIITFGFQIVWYIVSSILQKIPSAIGIMINLAFIMSPICIFLFAGTAFFESIGLGILIYRKYKRDLANAINNKKQ